MKTKQKQKIQDRICPRCDRRGLVMNENSVKVLRCDSCGWTKHFKRGKRKGRG